MAQQKYVAKNPAVLWYPSDFIASTVFWTNEQCGAYIRLLNFQFTVGHLSEKQLHQITDDEEVLKKFVKDEFGLFYNIRLEKEIDKRQKYSESRSRNRKGTTYDEHMINISTTYDKHMENENININKNINIIDYFNNNIHSIVPREYEEITNWEKTFTDDIIKKAIDIAVLNNAKNMNYINSILRNWKEKGYKSLADVNNENSNIDLFQYDWLNDDGGVE